ncbi:MAG: winged helix-turn-helix transcriptional regulator [Lachnospiraceae bacterium]|nr:winged helix-turn-helix transcriptional regulator [Lachnospiraceae bacterium]
MSFQDSFKALSDPTRREILNLLRAGPMAAGELLEHFPITGASLSHHLSILRHAGLIDDEKKGKYIYYTLNTTVLDDILNWMMSLKGTEKGESNHDKS